MVYRIRPMQETKVDFENRPYKLGETIHIRVELNPRRDLDVREVRVELICEATYNITESVTLSARPSRAVHTSAMMSRGKRKRTKERKDSFVHSSAVFGKQARLQAGKSQIYDVKFEIKPQPPYYSKQETDFKWRLNTVVDVVRGRNPRARRTLNIALD